PITVCDNGDVTVYPDVESACDHLEVYDLSELWLADRFGRTLLATTHGYPFTGFVIDENREPALGELAKRLRAFTTSVGHQRVGVEKADELPVDRSLESLLLFCANAKK